VRHIVAGEYASTQTLAKRAFNNSNSHLIKAEACYHMARAYHAEGKYRPALQWYNQSVKEAPAFLPPTFGLGQMYLVDSQADEKKAIECFEKVLAHSPDNVDALRVLGMLYASTRRHAPRLDRAPAPPRPRLQRLEVRLFLARGARPEMALEKLSRVTELAPNDVGGWLELAKLHEKVRGRARKGWWVVWGGGGGERVGGAA
jgi:RNA polymerase-associated protein CTR9